MADYITKIRTDQGDLPYDYNSLANLPKGEVPDNTVLATGTIPAGTVTAAPTLVDTGITVGMLRQYKYFRFSMRCDDPKQYAGFLIDINGNVNQGLRLQYTIGENGWGTIHHWADDERTLAIGEVSTDGNTSLLGTDPHSSVINGSNGNHGHPLSFKGLSDNAPIKFGVMHMNGSTATTKDYKWGIHGYVKYGGQ